MSSVALHHQVAGPDGAPVLLLGGSLGTTLEVWQGLLPRLTGRLRVIAFDWRGHGRSPAPPGPYAMADLGGDLVALLDRLGVERASYAGVSLGGMVALWLGAHAGDRMERLVSMSAAAHLPAAAFEDRARSVRKAKSVEPLADAVVDRWLTPAYARRHADVRAWLRGMLAASPPEGYAACCEAIAGMDLRADLARSTAPTLVIGAAEDPSIPLEHQRALADGLPDARLEVIEGAAHLAFVERPDAVGALVLEHVLGR